MPVALVKPGWSTSIATRLRARIPLDEVSNLTMTIQRQLKNRKLAEVTSLSVAVAV